MTLKDQAGVGPLDAPVGRPVPERAGLRGFGVTITPGGAKNWYAGADGVRRWTSNDQPCDAGRRADGMPSSAAERYLRRLLAARVAMPHAYCDDGEAQGAEHGIVIDFMREPVADIDAKLRALNVARAECRAVDWTLQTR